MQCTRRPLGQPTRWSVRTICLGFHEAYTAPDAHPVAPGFAHRIIRVWRSWTAVAEKGRRSPGSQMLSTCVTKATDVASTEKIVEGSAVNARLLRPQRPRGGAGPDRRNIFCRWYRGTDRRSRGLSP